MSAEDKRRDWRLVGDRALRYYGATMRARAEGCAYESRRSTSLDASDLGEDVRAALERLVPGSSAWTVDEVLDLLKYGPGPKRRESGRLASGLVECASVGLVVGELAREAAGRATRYGAAPGPGRRIEQMIAPTTMPSRLVAM